MKIIERAAADWCGEGLTRNVEGELEPAMEALGPPHPKKDKQIQAKYKGYIHEF